MVKEKLSTNILKIIKAGQNDLNIWAQPPVNVVPAKVLDLWKIVKVVQSNVNQEQFEFHMVGRDIHECNGAVSSRIADFDPQDMQGKTQSGRVYKLIGLPGFDDDAEYVLRNWCNLYHVEVVDSSHEFLQRYGLNLEELK